MRNSEPRRVTAMLRRHWVIATVIGVLVLVIPDREYSHEETPPFGAVSMTGERLARARANPHYRGRRVCKSPAAG